MTKKVEKPQIARAYVASPDRHITEEPGVVFIDRAEDDNFINRVEDADDPPHDELGAVVMVAKRDLERLVALASSLGQRALPVGCEGVIGPEDGALTHDILGCWVQFDYSAVGHNMTSCDRLYRIIASLPGVWRVTPGDHGSYAIGDPAKTVGDLKRALSQLPDNLPVRIEASANDGQDEITGEMSSMGVVVNEPKGTDCHDDRYRVGSTFVIHCSVSDEEETAS